MLQISSSATVRSRKGVELGRGRGAPESGRSRRLRWGCAASELEERVELEKTDDMEPDLERVAG